MTTKKQNITLDPELLEDFCKYAGPMGIKISTWVAAKMREFVKEQKMLEEMRKNKDKGIR